MSQSIIILYSIPVFISMIAFEFIYGLRKRQNTYRLNDTFCSLTLGILSRFPPMLNLGFTSLIYSLIIEHLGIDLLPTESWLTWLMTFLLYDLCYYWHHRLSHERTLLWASHVVHHQSEDYNLGTALRQTGTSFLFSWIFYFPLFVIGVPVEVFITVAAVNLVYQFWVHTEHIGSMGIFDRILVTPSNHRVHHARNKHYIDANYGGVFILWDRIFGTFVDEKAMMRPIYGTIRPLRSWNPVWANVEIYYQMFHDTWHTEKMMDKFRIWLSRTGWRPADVERRFPVAALTAQDSIKYDTVASAGYQVYTVFQFLIWMLLTFLAFSTIEQQSGFESVSLVAIILASTIITSGHLESKEISAWLEIIRSIVVLFLVLIVQIWHMDLFFVKVMWVHALINLIIMPFFIVSRLDSFNTS